MTYGCFNHPRPTESTTYPVQAGWVDMLDLKIPCRVPVYVNVKHKLSLDCQYTLTTVDAGCVGRKWDRGHEVKTEPEPQDSPPPPFNPFG